MKNKFLKVFSLVLSFGIAVSNLTNICAGGLISKSKQTKLSENQKYIISRPEYLPGIAQDGGKAYFNAWNGANGGQNFKIFVQAYASKIDNETSASTLKDSVKNENWRTGIYYPDYPRKIEATESWYGGEYLLRVDYENKIIYTIRKFGDEYLCTFYTLCFGLENSTHLRAGETYFLLLSSDSKVKQLLLPIDRELLH